MNWLLGALGGWLAVLTLLHIAGSSRAALAWIGLMVVGHRQAPKHRWQLDCCILLVCWPYEYALQPWLDPHLQWLTAVATTTLLQLFGWPIHMVAAQAPAAPMLQTPAIQVAITSSCAGLATLLTLLTICILLLCLTPNLSKQRMMATVATALLGGWLLNVGRISTSVVAAHYVGRCRFGDHMHDVIGYSMFAAGYWGLWRFWCWLQQPPNQAWATSTSTSGNSVQSP